MVVCAEHGKPAAADVYSGEGGVTKGLQLSIPPVYAEHLGRQVMRLL